MSLFVRVDASGIGSGDFASDEASVDLAIIANDSGIGLDPVAAGRQQVTYARTMSGAPQIRLDDLVNTAFSPDYGSGPQNVDIEILPVLSNFTLNDGTSIANNGITLPPSNSGLAGADLNTTNQCLVLYDTQQTVCVARAGTGALDLPITNPVVVYHELSHAFRIVNNTLLALTAECDPASPEESAAIVDENDMRTQIANTMGTAPELRDPTIHCGQVCGAGGGSCCIIASVSSGSPASPQVQMLRAVRDRFARRTEVGFAFFDQLFFDYYSFSPQVCTMMAQRPGLAELILAGYVEPLIEFWNLIVARSAGRLQDGLGVEFRRRCEDHERASASLAAMREASIFRTGDATVASGLPTELRELLMERAWPSPHVRWALIEPVAIYHDALAAMLQGADAAQIEEYLDTRLDAWAPEIPLDHVWNALPKNLLQRELRVVEGSLLPTPRGQARLRRRLEDRFGQPMRSRLAGALKDGGWS